MALRIRRKDTGAVILEITDRLTRLIGTLSISGSNSYTFPAAEGAPFFYVRYPSNVDQNNTAASITLGGAGNRVLSWVDATPGTQIVVGLY
jgi:hypothetical protein